MQLQHSQGANLGQDKISRLLFQLALPAILAQLINLLYNMVDRMYIGPVSYTHLTLPTILRV